LVVEDGEVVWELVFVPAVAAAAVAVVEDALVAVAR